jgi:hypothetical protein
MRRLVAVAMPVLLTLVLVACSTARLVDAPNTDTPAAGPTTSPAAVTIPGTASTAACSAAARWAHFVLDPDLTDLAGRLGGEALHWLRDARFDEDRSQVRASNGPQVMAAEPRDHHATTGRDHEHQLAQPDSGTQYAIREAYS